MTETPAPPASPPMTRRALTEREYQLVLDFRAKNAATLAYNEGVEAAAALVAASTTELNGNYPSRQALAAAIRALLRKV